MVSFNSGWQKTAALCRWTVLKAFQFVKAEFLRLRCCQATVDSLMVVPGSASITNIRTMFSFNNFNFYTS